MPSCRKIFDNLDIKKGSNAALLMARYVKNLDDKQNSKLELFDAMRNAAKNAYDLYLMAFENRRRALKAIASSKIFQTVDPLIAGLGNSNVLETGLSLNPTYGLPMLPASSIKGVTAHYCSKVFGSSDPDYKAPMFDDRGQVIEPAGKIYSALFGKIYPQEEQEAGYLRFYDAWIIPPRTQKKMELVFVDDVMTPHNTSYYSSKDKNKRPSEFEEPKPVRFLNIRGDFEFWISCLDDDPEQRKQWTEFAFNITREALESFGIGGKLNAGYGKMKCLLSEDQQREQEKKQKSTANRQAGYNHDEGETVQVICKKIRIVKGKEKRDFIFSQGTDNKAIRFDTPPKIDENAAVNAKILRIDRSNNAYILQVI